MNPVRLTEDEQKVFDGLLSMLPMKATIRKPTHIWIIEWLSSGNRRTGEELHQWMQERRYDFKSVYCRCSTKEKVLAAIERAAAHAEHHGTLPLIHLEAHGSEGGLFDSKDSNNMLKWDDLSKPLQILNRATQCNLIVLVAACKGYAGLQSFIQAFNDPSLIPVAPALVISGPIDELTGMELLLGTKEFYRRLADASAEFDDLIINASRESGNEFRFQRVLFPVLLYEAFLINLIPLYMRSDLKDKKMGQLRNRFFKENSRERLSAEEERRLEEAYSPTFQAELYQKAWDAIFMVDSYPENRKRFGLNWLSVIKRILDIQENNLDKIQTN